MGSFFLLLPLVIFLDEFTEGNGFLKSFISAIPASVLLFSFIIYLIYRNLKSKYDKENNQNLMMKFSNAEKYAKGQIWEVITNGSKTIATVVDIQYISSDQQYIKRVKSSTKSTSTTNSNNCDNAIVRFIVRNSPAFKVKYKFNPPDDSKEEDLVHEFIMHHEPEKYLKIGDPLPILYWVKRDNDLQQRHDNVLKVHETVTSIPYPFILDNVSQFQDVLYDSSNEFLKYKSVHDGALGNIGMIDSYRW